MIQINISEEYAICMLQSEYVAKTDSDACIDCGDCIPRCTFGARRLQQEQLAYDPDLCMGCGLCVTVPVEATFMKLRGAVSD